MFSSAFWFLLVRVVMRSVSLVTSTYFLLLVLLEGRFHGHGANVHGNKWIDCNSDDDMDDAMVDALNGIAFHIYGLSRGVIDSAIKEIDEFSKDATTDKVLDSPEDQAQIAKLSKDQVNCSVYSSTYYSFSIQILNYHVCS